MLLPGETKTRALGGCGDVMTSLFLFFFCSTKSEERVIVWSNFYPVPLERLHTMSWRRQGGLFDSFDGDRGER